MVVILMVLLKVLSAVEWFRPAGSEVGVKGAGVAEVGSCRS